MYATFLLLHSWDRWLIVLFGVLAIIGAFKAARQRSRIDLSANRFGLFYVLALDVQLLLGIVLFGWLTPWLTVMMKSPASAMSDRLTRYWVVEHLFGMIVAIVLAHFGRAVMKKGNYSKAAVFFLISMIILLATMPWPFMPYPRPLFRF